METSPGFGACSNSCSAGHETDVSWQLSTLAVVSVAATTLRINQILVVSGFYRYAIVSLNMAQICHLLCVVDDVWKEWQREAAGRSILLVIDGDSAPWSSIAVRQCHTLHIIIIHYATRFHFIHLHLAVCYPDTSPLEDTPLWGNLVRLFPSRIFSRL